MSADNQLQTYHLEAFEISVCRVKSHDDFEIWMRHGDKDVFRMSADQIGQLRELLQQAELYARYQQQLSRQSCPTCGETAFR